MKNLPLNKRASWATTAPRVNMALCLAAVMFGATSAAHAASQTWNNGSGNFIWDTSSLNWGGAAWTAGSDAVFGATGVGTITVSGTQSVGTGSDTPLTFSTAGYTLTGGTLAFPAASTSTLLVSSDATIDSILSDPSTTSVFAKTGAGNLTLNPGALGTNTVGILKASAGNLTLQSGTLNLIGGGTGATAGGFEVAGGTVTVAGETLNSSVGSYGDIQAKGTLNVTAGSCNILTVELLNGYSTAGTINLSGSGVLNVNILRVTQAAAAPGGVVNLNGGTLQLNRFNTAAGIGTVNFNGSTVQAKSSLANFTATSATTTYNVQAGGAIFDTAGYNPTNTAGYNITIAAPLTHDNTLGAIPDGGVVKTGAGTLTFSGTNTYTGPTTVNGGTLTISNATLAANSIVTIASGGILDLEFAGNNTVLALVLGGVVMPAGTYNAASTPAYFTGTGSLVSVFGSNANPTETWTGAVNNNWDTTTTNWSQSGAAATWINAPSPANAIFNAAGAGTINLTQPINANSLLFTAAGYTIAGNTLTLGSAAPNVSAAAATTISSTLSGSLVCDNAGTLTLSGANAFTGGVTNQGGILALGNLNALQGATAGAVIAGSVHANQFGTFANVPTFVLNGLGVGTGADYGALDFDNGSTGTVVWDGNLVLASTAAINSYGITYTVNLNGVISGPGNLILAAQGGDNSADTAVHVLNQRNTYQGTTQILNRKGLSSYTVQLGAANALPTTTSLDISTTTNVSGQSASLDLNGFNQTLAGLTSTASASTRSVENSSGTPATLTISNAVASVFTGVLGYSHPNFSLLKQGAGTLTITNANGYNGDTTVSGGRLVTSPTSSGNGTYEVAANATLEIQILSPYTTLYVSSLTLAGGSTNTITLLVPGNPGAAPIYAGNLTVNGPATINLAGSQFAPGTFTLITYGSGGVGGTGGFSALHLGTLPAGVQAQLVNSGSSVDLQILALPRNLTWQGTVNGVWDINGTSNWLNTDTSAKASYNEANNIGDNVTFDDTATGTTSITLNTTVHPDVWIANNNGLSYTISGNGKISGPAGLQMLGSGTLVLATTNDYSGVTTLGGSYGTLQIGNGGTIGSLGTNTVTVTASGATLAFNRTNTLAVNNAIVNGGANPNVVFNSGTVILGGSAGNTGLSATVNSSATIVLAKASSPTVDAVDGGLFVNSGGLVQLGGTGGNQINDAITVLMNGGTFDLAGQNETFTGFNGYGVITNSGANGTVTLSGNQGLTAINGLLLLSGGTINSTVNDAVYAGATFQMTGGAHNCGNVFYNGIYAGSGVAAADFEGGTFSCSSQLVVGFQNAGQLTVGGSALLNLSVIGTGDPSSATVYLNGGTVALQYFHNRGSGPSQIYFNGSLVRATANVGTFIEPVTDAFISTNGAIIDSQANAIGIPQPLESDPALAGGADGGLTKLGTGSLTLSATNTYTGPTVVSNGTLVVNGVLGNGAVSVGVGTTLAGSGIIGGPVTVKTNGTLNVGGVATNVLTINNTLTFMPGSTNVAIISSTNGTSDLVKGITTANYAGTLQVNNLASPNTPTNGQTFQIFSASGFSGNFTNITSAPGAGLAWSFAPSSGILSVVSVVSQTAPNITSSVTGSNLTLSWAADHTGWRLLEQTNHLNLGVSSNTNDWATVNGSALTNQVTIPIAPAKPGDYYRLVYP
jgi:fibronectin-binding autotransporter adhesin